VLYMKWTEVKARTAIWEEALAELIADAFDDEWEDDEDYEDEAPEPAPKKEPAPEVKEEPETKADSDDPNVNPYSS